MWPCLAACGNLVPWPWIEPVPPALKLLSHNHWTAREVSELTFRSMPHPSPSTVPWACCVVLAPGSHTSWQVCFTKDSVGLAMGQQDKLLLFLCKPLEQLDYQSWGQNYPPKDWSSEWWTFSFPFFPNRNLAGNFLSFFFFLEIFTLELTVFVFCVFFFFPWGKISGAFGFFPSEKPSLLLQIPLLLYLVNNMAVVLVNPFKKMTACRVQVLDGWLKFNSLHCV